MDPHTADVSPAVEKLALDAINAYNAKELPKAYKLYSEIASIEPENPVWVERRGQVAVDMKLFSDAIRDFDHAEAMYKKVIGEGYVSLGLMSNRALAYEGLYQWRDAIRDYDQALQYASQVGYSIPYVLNSRGNCHSSLAAEAESEASAADPDPEWRNAQSDYQEAARVFQRSRNLPGAIFAASNAALISAQLGDDARALRELKSVARRAPGSIDMRAAIAALYWAAGDQRAAEEAWEWACSKINSGQLVAGGPVLDSCSRYADADWLERIRRWPPVMVDRMQDFLALKPPTAPARL